LRTILESQSEKQMDHTKSRKALKDRDGETPAQTRPQSLPHGTTKDQIAEMESEGQAREPRNESGAKTPAQDGREGATDKEVGDRTGPGAGYDMEPEQERDRGGVA
jgi:hypothetical protein